MILRAFAADRSGASSIEYGLIAVLICLAIIGGFTLFANATVGLFASNTNSISNVLSH